MAVDFIRANPTTDVMARSAALNEEQSRAEQEAFQRRRQYEEANAADKALREGIGAYYAGQDQQPAAAVTPGAPPAAPAAVPAQPVPATPVVAPQQQAAAPPMPAAVPAPSGDGFGDAERLPTDQQAVPAPTPAPAAAAPAPAVIPAAAPAQPRTPGGPNVAAQTGQTYAPIVKRLVQSPGTGAAAMQLFAADRQQQQQLRTLDRQQRLDGMKEFLAAIKDGDTQLARFAANQYGLGVPDTFFTNRQHIMRAQVAVSTADKLFGKDNPKATMMYVKGYLEAGPDAAPDQSSLAGMKAVQASGVGGRVAGHYVDANNNVQFYDKEGKDPNAPDKPLPKARPQKWQVSGGGSDSVFEKKQAAYLKVHPGDEQGALDYASGRKQVSPEQVRNWVESAVAREESHRVRPFTPAERKDVRRQYEQSFGLVSDKPERAQPAGGKPGGAGNDPMGLRRTATVPEGEGSED